MNMHQRCTHFWWKRKKKKIHIEKAEKKVAFASEMFVVSLNIIVVCWIEARATSKNYISFYYRFVELFGLRFSFLLVFPLPLFLQFTSLFDFSTELHSNMWYTAFDIDTYVDYVQLVHRFKTTRNHNLI